MSAESFLWAVRRWMGAKERRTPALPGSSAKWTWLNGKGHDTTWLVAAKPAGLEGKKV
ncbi:MAG: hypothetical protein HY059_09500 [Proteobacteria bacterium]|nr:hypothetical protein [Pseudomonadota bacterium]